MLTFEQLVYLYDRDAQLGPKARKLIEAMLDADAKAYEVPGWDFTADAKDARIAELEREVKGYEDAQRMDGEINYRLKQEVSRLEGVQKQDGVMKAQLRQEIENLKQTCNELFDRRDQYFQKWCEATKVSDQHKEDTELLNWLDNLKQTQHNCLMLQSYGDHTFREEIRMMKQGHA
jgi:chromosome segregation ATPase